MEDGCVVRGHSSIIKPGVERALMDGWKERKDASAAAAAAAGLSSTFL